MLSKRKNRAYGELLCWLLRHEPQKLGLEMDSQGWVCISVLLHRLTNSEHHPTITPEELQYVVSTDGKGRYSISDCDKYIRCNQGHSIPHVKGMSMSAPSDLVDVYHGTSVDNYIRIQCSGSIKPMSRNHVHLSASVDTAKKVGARHGGDVVVLKIDTVAASKSGVDFQVSNNNVWLSGEIPLEFVSVHNHELAAFALGSDFHIEEAAVFQNKKSTRPFVTECLTFPEVPDGTDVLLLAGDICELKKIDMYRKVLSHYSALVKDIVLVCGNHEFWGSSYQSGLERIDLLKLEFPNVHFLENEEIELNGVRIYGATMWSNFNHDTYIMSELNNVYSSIRGAPLDARRIKWRNKYGSTSKGKSEHLYALNKKSVKALGEFLSTVVDTDRVVICTHFPLTPEKVQPKNYGYDWAGVDISILKGRQNIQLAHGHLHCEESYKSITGQDVWLNPRGIVDVKRPENKKSLTYKLKSFKA